MENLVWIGAVITLLGLGGLLWCIRKVMKAKNSKDEEAIKTAIQQVMAPNLIALFLSVIGLMCVVLGVVLA